MATFSQMTNRPSRLAVSWFIAELLVVGLAGLTSLLIAKIVGAPNRQMLPVAFSISTASLAVVSAGLFDAEKCAKREKQGRLRRALVASLSAAVLFLAVQGIALGGLLRLMSPTDAAIGATVSVFVAVALHALHVSAAVGWLVFVALCGFAGRYDHEYSFGLTACGWCWHALGIVWLAILVAFIAAV